MNFNLSYFKRFRMERKLSEAIPDFVVPEGFVLVPWSDRILEAHAETKCRAFQEDLDRYVFPNLGHLPGCLDLMRAIRRRPGFCPAATWLIRQGADECGTIQAVINDENQGAIQNLGVVPEYRRQGLGAVLLTLALLGLQQVGATSAMLEVTAQNHPAMRLYRRFDFRATRTVYKPVQFDTTTIGLGL